MEKHLKTAAPLGMSAVLKAVIAAVRLTAAEEISPRYTRILQQRHVNGDEGEDLVAVIDAALVRKLQAIVNVPVLDAALSPAEQHALWQTGEAWCVNPLDSVPNFLRGLPHFSVSAALLREGKIVLGVVYAPAEEEMYVAEVGKGGFRNGQRIAARNMATRLDEALAGVDLRRLNTGLIARLSVQPPYLTQRNFGAYALDWCYAATGRYDVYLHGGQQLWEYAAGALIFQEAGGFLSCIDHDDFEQGNVWQRSVIASRDLCLFEDWRTWVRASLSR